MNFDMFEYYQMLRKNRINVIYSGPIWQEGIEGIAETVKRRLAFDDLPLSKSQAIFSVFIEQITNMLMYSQEKEIYETLQQEPSEVPTGVFVFGRQDTSYFVQSGNIISEEALDGLKERIDFINSMDKAELRQYYKKQIKNENVNPQSKGAGLGFIEIARRASSKIDYSFVPLSEGLSFFTICVTV